MDGGVAQVILILGVVTVLLLWIAYRLLRAMVSNPNFDHGRPEDISENFAINEFSRGSQQMSTLAGRALPFDLALDSGQHRATSESGC